MAPKELSAGQTAALIKEFLDQGPYAVVGASTNRAKYGNKCLRVYQQHSLPVYPVNPVQEEIEGLKAYASLAELPETVRGISIITPPQVTERIVEEAARLGISYLWIQPGAESDKALERAAELGLKTIWGGPCILVALGYDDEA